MISLHAACYKDKQNFSSALGTTFSGKLSSVWKMVALLERDITDDEKEAS